MAVEPGYGVGWDPIKLAIALTSAGITVGDVCLSWEAQDKMSMFGRAYGGEAFKPETARVHVHCVDPLDRMDRFGFDPIALTPPVLEMFKASKVRSGYNVDWAQDFHGCLRMHCPDVLVVYPPTSDQRLGTRRVLSALVRAAAACNVHSDEFAAARRAAIAIRLDAVLKSPTLNSVVQGLACTHLGAQDGR